MNKQGQKSKKSTDKKSKKLYTFVIVAFVAVIFLISTARRIYVDYQLENNSAIVEGIIESKGIKHVGSGSRAITSVHICVYSFTYKGITYKHMEVKTKREIQKYNTGECVQVLFYKENPKICRLFSQNSYKCN